MEGHDSQEVDMEGQEIDVEKLDDIEKALCRIKDHYYVLYESRFSIQDIADHLMRGLVTWMGRFLALHLAMFGVIILGRHSSWFNFNITLVFVVAYVGGIMVPTYLGYCREERSVLTALSTLQQYHNLVCDLGERNVHSLTNLETRHT
ncbi:hypothetical protein O6P43_009377 [Quillaja saponaria]|uniref:Uncharacterized protein n=1 Tax=Quillaja saponaria TaxID=32244 RepID=A0AAD7PY55_QUISA|nr:hypothetical protein O6P43_009377 [Quillaja saponaria]